MKNTELKKTSLWLTLIIHSIPAVVVGAFIFLEVINRITNIFPFVVYYRKEFAILLYYSYPISAVICGIPALFIDIRNLKISNTAESATLLTVNALNIVSAALLFWFLQLYLII